MSSPVTQDDVDSVKDVPIEEAMNYLETLERERRGLLKVGTILRAVQKARNVQEAAELQRTQAEQRATEAKVALDALEISLASDQVRLDGLTVEIREAEGRLRAAKAAEDEEATRSHTVSASVRRTPSAPWTSSSGNTAITTRRSKLRRAPSS
jgi:chromosome segregation ATPase